MRFGRVGKMISGNRVPSDAYGYFSDYPHVLDEESLNDYRTMQRKLRLRTTQLERTLGVKPGDVFLVPRKRSYTNRFYLVEDLEFEDIGSTISIFETGVSIGPETFETASSLESDVWRILYVGLRVARDLNIGSFYLAATFLFNEQLIGTGIGTAAQTVFNMELWEWTTAKKFKPYNQLCAPETRKLYRKRYGISASPADGCVYLGEHNPAIDGLLLAKLFEEILKKEVSNYTE